MSNSLYIFPLFSQVRFSVNKRKKTKLSRAQVKVLPWIAVQWRPMSKYVNDTKTNKRIKTSKSADLCKQAKCTNRM